MNCRLSWCPLNTACLLAMPITPLPFGHLGPFCLIRLGVLMADAGSGAGRMGGGPGPRPGSQPGRYGNSGKPCSLRLQGHQAVVRPPSTARLTRINRLVAWEGLWAPVWTFWNFRNSGFGGPGRSCSIALVVRISPSGLQPAGNAFFGAYV